MTDAPPPPPPPPSVSPAVIKEMRLLMGILGGVLCAIALLSLCGGGFFLVMANLLPGKLLPELESAAATDEEAKQFLEVIRGFESWVRPHLGSLILGMTVSILTGTVLWAWLGIGAIRCRRWARKLLLAAGWAWCGSIVLQLTAFLVSLPMMMTAMQRMMPSSPSGGSGWMVMGPSLVIQLVVNLFHYALMAAPGVGLIILCSLKNVRLACEQIDPRPNWTDRVPIEVLPLWVFLVGAALQMAGTLPFLAPMAGFLPSLGWNAPALLASGLGATALLVGSAWLIARMSTLGWWLVLTGSVVGLAYAAFLIQRLDLLVVIRDVITALPLPEAERAEVEAELAKESQALEMAADWVRGSWLILAVSGVPFVAYLGWIYRWFTPPPAPAIRLP